MDSRNAVRVAKAISEPCQKHPVGFAKGKESKGDGGVYAKCVLKLSYQQCVVEITLAKSWGSCLLDLVAPNHCDAGKGTYPPWNSRYPM